jgi:hypothetical protein
VFQVGWNQAALPVMAMNDVRLKLYRMAYGQSSFTKVGKALEIIEIITFWGSIEVGSVKEFIPAYEVDFNAIVELTSIDISVNNLGAQLHWHVLRHWVCLRYLLDETVIERHYNSHVAAQVAQSKGQSTANVGEPPGLGKGRNLRKCQ